MHALKTSFHQLLPLPLEVTDILLPLRLERQFQFDAFPLLVDLSFGVALVDREDLGFIYEFLVSVVGDLEELVLGKLFLVFIDGQTFLVL
jgi:hypothetical protein